MKTLFVFVPLFLMIITLFLRFYQRGFVNILAKRNRFKALMLFLFILTSFQLQSQAYYYNRTSTTQMFIDISAGFAIPKGPMFSIGTHFIFPGNIGFSVSYMGASNVAYKRDTGLPSFFGGDLIDTDVNKFSSISVRFLKELMTNNDGLNIGIESGFSSVHHKLIKTRYTLGPTTFFGQFARQDRDLIENRTFGFSGKIVVKFDLSKILIFNLYSCVELNEIFSTGGAGIGVSFYLGR